MNGGFTLLRKPRQSIRSRGNRSPRGVRQGDHGLARGRWLKETSLGQPRFISDNNGYDWQFINWYFHNSLGRNPFGYSSTNLGSLYKGLVGDVAQNFKRLRKTAHTHHPVDDARGNAEALLHMRDVMGLKIDLR